MKVTIPDGPDGLTAAAEQELASAYRRPTTRGEFFGESPADSLHLSKPLAVYNVSLARRFERDWLKDAKQTGWRFIAFGGTGAPFSIEFDVNGEGSLLNQGRLVDKTVEFFEQSLGDDREPEYAFRILEVQRLFAVYAWLHSSSSDLLVPILTRGEQNDYLGPRPPEMLVEELNIQRDEYVAATKRYGDNKGKDNGGGYDNIIPE